jgi:hypothetical protein
MARFRRQFPKPIGPMARCAAGAKQPNEYRDFQEPTNDEWAMPFLDKRVLPALESDEDRTLKATLRRMRRKARVAETLIATNKKLRQQLRDRPSANSNHHHEPTETTRQQVATLAGMGLSKKDICTFMNFSAPVLNDHYIEDIEIGRIHANVAVADTLHSIATDRKHFGVIPAAKKWLESRAPDEWKDVKRIEHGSVSSSAEEIIDVSVLSADERIQFRAMLEKMVQAKESPPLITDESVVAEQEADDDAA